MLNLHEVGGLGLDRMQRLEAFARLGLGVLAAWKTRVEDIVEHHGPGADEPADCGAREEWEALATKLSKSRAT